MNLQGWKINLRRHLFDAKVCAKHYAKCNGREKCIIPDLEETHHSINKLACIEHHLKYFMGINSFNPQFPALSTVISIEDVTEAVQNCPQYQKHKHMHTHKHAQFNRPEYFPGNRSGVDIGVGC